MLLAAVMIFTLACSNPAGGSPKAASSPSVGDEETVTVDGVVPFTLIYVPAGSFQRDSDLENISVITKGYWMGETEVTQELWASVMNGTLNPVNPAYSDAVNAPYGAENGLKRPVERITWYTALEFCNILSQKTGKEPVYTIEVLKRDFSGLDQTIHGEITKANVTADWSKNGYRLPTEMEWLWAAMGADTSEQPNRTGYSKTFAGSNGTNNVKEYVWYNANSDDQPHEVGLKKPNEIGLYDMSGNVWEWSWDMVTTTAGSVTDTYPAGTITDYRGSETGKAKVWRGGAWGWNANTFHDRYCYDPESLCYYIGFRVVCGE
jgi:formylglycine-generating enzyme required for sulfatase activity